MLSPQITPQAADGPEPSVAHVERTEVGRHAVRLWQVVTAIALGMTVLLALWPSAGHDQLWLLLVAARMNSSLDPYRQVFEANPPLAAWLSLGLLHIANGLRLPAPVVLKGVVVLLASLVAFVCDRLLGPRRDTARWFLLAVFVLVAGAAPARDFAQRDHVLALLMLPYLVLAVRPVRSVGLRAGSALAAALAVALKPHQVLVVAAVECLFAVRRGRPRWLEPGLLFLVGGAYLLLVWWFTPEFPRDILPVLRDTYWANGGLSFAALLRESVQLHTVAICALVLFFTGSRKDPLAAVLLAAGVGATAAYYLQDTGWYYHQLPALLFYSLALALLLLDRMRRPVDVWMPAAAGGLGVVALGLTFYFMNFQPNPLLAQPRGLWARLVALDPPQDTPAPELYAGLPAGAGVLTLTPTVDDAIMPVVLYHLTLAQRYPQFWMLPALLRADTADLPPRRQLPLTRWAELASLQRRMMREDLDRWHPALILVERCEDPTVLCQAIGARHSNLLTFFLADPEFRSRFQRYRLVERVGNYDAYRLLP